MRLTFAVPLLAVLVTGAAPALASDPFSLDALLDDTAVPEDARGPSALWPTAAVIDAGDQTLTLTWPNEPTETLPFAAILQIEHARAWDADPEELFALFSDGRRVLLDRGDGVSKNVTLLKAWLATKMIEMPIGEGHAQPPDTTSASPALTVATGGGSLTVGRLNPVAPASTPQASAPCTDCIAQADIDRIVKTRMDKIRGCYQRALRDNPGLSGNLVVKFVVGRDGGTANAVVKDSGLGNVQAEQCVLEQFLQLRFPRPPGNQEITASYPLMFSAR